MGNIREGRWQCPRCGAENRGRNESCSGLDGQSGCGDARPIGLIPSLPKDSPVVTNAAELADARSGADWYCDHCAGANKNALNGTRVTQCVHCGEGRDAADTDNKVVDYAEGQVPRTHVEANPPRPSRGQTQVTTPVVTAGSYGYIFAVAAGVLAVVSLVWYFFIASFTIDAHVTGFSWNRSVTIERYQTLREHDWDIPSGGRKVTSALRIRSYREVFDHTEKRTRPVPVEVPTGSVPYSCGSTDLGNGYFEDKTCYRDTFRTEYDTETYYVEVTRKEPVKDIWYTYDIERWVVDRTPSVSGLDQSPVWPVYVLAGSYEHVSARHEEYIVNVVDVKNRSYTHDLPLEDWLQLRVSQPLVLTRNHIGMILDLKPQ